MEKNDPHSRYLLELVREQVRRSGRSHRDLERALDLGHGTLGNIFRGRTELRFRHLVLLSRVLDFDPADLLAAAFSGPTSRPPVRTLPVSLEELRALVKEAVREELNRRGRGKAPAGEQD